jgi:anti-anti-sigma factor
MEVEMYGASEETRNVRVIDFASLRTRKHQGRDVKGTWKELAEPRGHVILDLEGVGHLDQTGLSTLLRFSKHVRSSGGVVSLASLGKTVRLQAQMMRLYRMLDIFNSLEEALGSTPD